MKKILLIIGVVGLGIAGLLFPHSGNSILGAQPVLNNSQIITTDTSISGGVPYINGSHLNASSTFIINSAGEPTIRNAEKLKFATLTANDISLTSTPTDDLRIRAGGGSAIYFDTDEISLVANNTDGINTNDVGLFVVPRAPIVGGDWIPNTNSFYDLGTTTNRWRSISVGSSATSSLTGPTTFGGTTGNEKITINTAGRIRVGNPNTLEPNVGKTYPSITVMCGAAVTTGSDCINVGNTSDGWLEIEVGAIGSELCFATGNDEKIACKDSWPSGGYTYGNGLTSMTYGTGNGDGKVGIGTTTPYTSLSVVGSTGIVANKYFATSTTATSTFAGGFIAGNNAIVENVSSGTTTISNLNIGNLNFDTNAGIVTALDLPITSSAGSGTVESYTFNVMGSSTLTLYGQANGSGFVKNNTLGVGISTTSPYATLSVQSGSNTGDAFVVATTTRASIGGYDNDGHRFTAGPPPTLSTCGTGSPTITGDDQTGTITTGTAATACTMTFSKAYQQTPVCNFNDDSSTIPGDVSSISTTAITFALGAGLSGGHLYYSCVYHRAN